MQNVLVNLFPLSDVVLYPHASVPLNIFEPRYIKMVHHSINTHTPIALALTNFFENEQFVLKTNTGDFSGLVVGVGYPQIIHENVDGSMFIMLKGVGKARLIENTNDKNFRVYSAQMIDEVYDVSDAHRFRLNRLRIMLKNWLEMNIKSKEDRETFFKKIVKPEEIIAYAAHFLIENPTHKKEILEVNSLTEKLELVLEHSKFEERPLEGKILAI